MSDILDFYQQQASAQFSEVPWLAHLQEKALTDFSRMGFPNTHQEDWKYTRLDAFLEHPFSNACSTKNASNTPLAEIDVNLSVAFVNGEWVGLEALSAILPKGVVIQPLTQAVAEHAEKIKPYLSQVLQQEHGFQALNTAMLNKGLFIYIPKGVHVSEPLLLSCFGRKENGANYLRHVVILEAESSFKMIEDYQGDEHACYATNTITEVSLAPCAKLTHYKIQRESKKAYHIGHLAVKQAKGSQLDSHSFSIGGKCVRSDITIDLNEPEAQCLMNGVYVPADQQHIDHHTLVTHKAPNCTSVQDYKGVLSGHSRAVFNGRVLVAKGAQHTQAKQQNKNLLLSTNTEVDTKPQLEIFADDVVCTHGATVGQLDEEALFYLATRGIGRAEASRYLVQAFIEENIRTLGDNQLAKWISTLLRG